MAGTKRFDEFEALVRHEALEIAGPNPALHCAKPCCDAGGGDTIVAPRDHQGRKIHKGGG